MRNWLRPPARRKRYSSRLRQLRASWRDTLLLLRQFAWPLFFFLLAMVGGGLLYEQLARLAHTPLDSRAEAIYLVLTLTFLQPVGEFPEQWYLQIFYFLMPVIGISILAQGLADFGVSFFNRRARSKEWEMAVASTFNKHIVLVGLGHLGFRVMKALHEMEQDVVVIELKPDAELVNQTHARDVPVIHEDAKRESALVAANVAQARAIVLCTQNDSLNVLVALRARKLNPKIDVVLRIFDDVLAETVEEQFGFRAMSATGMAAPSFAAAATRVDITRPVTVEGQAFSLARLDITEGSRLNGRAVADIEQSYDLSVVLIRRNRISDFHPAPDRCLQANDVLAVLGGPEQISRLAGDNQG